MIDKREGSLFVPTKQDGSLTLPVGKNLEVKILDDHSILFIKFRKTGSKRRIIDVKWHFYEEINDESHPWHNKIRFHLDEQTSEKRRLFNQTKRTSPG